MKKNIRNTLLLIAIPLITIVLIMTVVNNTTEKEKVEYSDIVQKFYTDSIDSFSLNLSNGRLEYFEKSDKDVKKVYEVPNVEVFYNDIGGYLKEKNLDAVNVTGTDAAGTISYNYTVSKGGWIVSMLPTIFIFGALILFWIVMMRKMGGMGGADKAMGFGKAKFFCFLKCFIKRNAFVVHSC